MSSMLLGELAALLVQGRQLLKQIFLRVEPNGTAIVADGGSLWMTIKHVQELQGRLQAQRRPYGVITNGC